MIAEEVLGDGVSGFMADFGEGLPFDAELDDGLPAYEHNRWPALWARTVALACDRAGQPDCVTWMRSGSLGQAREVPLFWAGDQLVDWSERGRARVRAARDARRPASRAGRSCTPTSAATPRSTRW